MGKLTKAEIGRKLWGPHSGGSENAIYVLLEMLGQAESDAEFWRIFQIGWPNANVSWSWRGLMHGMLANRPPACEFLEGKDKELYDSLPDTVDVYRGSSSERAVGLAWTTDLEIAQQFARGYGGAFVPSPVIASAKIPKSAIFTVIMDRNEYEILLDSEQLVGLEVAPYPSLDQDKQPAALASD